ncbi:MAG: tetratricopeptide repeat protein [Myxococcota bacterium]
MPGVVLFADALGDQRWAFAPAPTGGGEVWGLWTGERLEPIYATFDAWFVAEVARIEGRVVREEDLDALRREVAPEDPYLLVRAGARAVADGRIDEAATLLGEATRLAPNDPRAWQLLGDAMAVSDPSVARQAWLGALRRTRLPVPWPGAPR